LINEEGRKPYPPIFYAPFLISNIGYCNQCGDYIPGMSLFAATEDKRKKSTIRYRRIAAKKLKLNS